MGDRHVSWRRYARIRVHSSIAQVRVTDGKANVSVAIGVVDLMVHASPLKWQGLLSNHSLWAPTSYTFMTGRPVPSVPSSNFDVSFTCPLGNSLESATLVIEPCRRRDLLLHLSHQQISIPSRSAISVMTTIGPRIQTAEPGDEARTAIDLVENESLSMESVKSFAGGSCIGGRYSN